MLSRIGDQAEQWRKCPKCGAWLSRERLRQAGICLECGHYFRLGAHDRIAQLVEDGSFQEFGEDLTATDPLDFTDRLPYPERLRQAITDTGLAEAVVTGTARMGGHDVVVAVLDFDFLGGSMGAVVGDKIVYAAEHALRAHVPLLAVSASGGARMQEGVISLVQMARTAAAIGRLRKAGVPYISVLTDPVYGGVAASFAALGDVIVAEEGARAGFTGPRVIAQTMAQELPDGFQRAEFLKEQGHVDLVIARSRLPELLGRLVEFTAVPDEYTFEPDAAPRRTPRQDDPDPWAAVRAVRDTARPDPRAYIDRVWTGFVELGGDRWSGDDPALCGGLAWLDGVPTVVLGHRKGSDPARLPEHNYGMSHPAGYRKAVRLMELAQRWGLPVITLIDTPGAYPGVTAEQDNQSGAIAETLLMAAGVAIPVLCVVTGEGGSGGALALAVGDRLLMQENATLSVISPEGCAAILFNDSAHAPEAARALHLRAADLHRLGLVDAIVPEPPEGAGADPDAAARLLAGELREHLAPLLATAPEDLVARRWRRLHDLDRRWCTRLASETEG
ncbi:acetyl-CoA carboxylase carboxyl transferase subunit beta [Nonomuraea solani]|uniref:Multifunctional fusion protein n=1 Tax=Nonomuraea solani TaxID=1144553 RepID=A0A1H6EFB0_9ACTN|nr:carboxyl transferase domain-containing protein [Nonomuraea solani]SEG95485.1 acetyl-CoA carboxylase carboxyl transferase subunit beta [Nonomuraea solani]